MDGTVSPLSAIIVGGVWEIVLSLHLCQHWLLLSTSAVPYALRDSR